jgi:hypothetical protein
VPTAVTVTGANDLLVTRYTSEEKSALIAYLNCEGYRMKKQNGWGTWYELRTNHDVPTSAVQAVTFSRRISEPREVQTSRQTWSVFPPKWPNTESQYVTYGREE